VSPITSTAPFRWSRAGRARGEGTPDAVTVMKQLAEDDEIEKQMALVRAKATKAKEDAEKKESMEAKGLSQEEAASKEMNRRKASLTGTSASGFSLESLAGAPSAAPPEPQRKRSAYLVSTQKKTDAEQERVQAHKARAKNRFRRATGIVVAKMFDPAAKVVESWRNTYRESRRSRGISHDHMEQPAVATGGKKPFSKMPSLQNFAKSMGKSRKNMPVHPEGGG